MVIDLARDCEKLAPSLRICNSEALSMSIFNAKKNGLQILIFIISELQIRKDGGYERVAFAYASP